MNFKCPAADKNIPICLAVRPNLSDYDEVYYTRNPVTTLAGQCFHFVVIQDTFESFLKEDAYKKIWQWSGVGSKFCNVLMNDVHYYIPSLPYVPNLNLFVSGLLFETWPGRYLLPCGEGEYSVFTDPTTPSEQRINMKTNGTSWVYSHQNILF